MSGLSWHRITTACSGRASRAADAEAVGLRSTKEDNMDFDPDVKAGTVKVGSLLRQARELSVHGNEAKERRLFDEALALAEANADPLGSQAPKTLDESLEGWQSRVTREGIPVRCGVLTGNTSGMKTVE